jgi:hypothetical protein
VCLAVGDPAADGRPDAGRLAGVQPVQIEADVYGVDAAGHAVQGVLDDGRDPALVDVGHRVGRDRTLAECLALPVVEGAQSHEGDVLGVDADVGPVGARELSPPEDGRQRHPVDVAARRRLGGVEVAVRVEPDDAEVAVPGQTRGGPDGDGVIPAEHERELAVGDGLRDRLREAPADRPRLVEELRAALDGFARVGVAFLRSRNREVPAVRARESHPLQLVGQAGVPDRRGPHVHAAPVRAEVHRHADDACCPVHGSPSTAGEKSTVSGRRTRKILVDGCGRLAHGPRSCSPTPKEVVTCASVVSERPPGTPAVRPFRETGVACRTTTLRP